MEGQCLETVNEGAGAGRAMFERKESKGLLFYVFCVVSYNERCFIGDGRGRSQCDCDWYLGLNERC